MKKYTITLSEEQMRLVADCMEDVSRFASGQMELRWTIEGMLSGLDFEEKMKRRDHAHVLLAELKRVLLPQMHTNESYGYNSTEFIGNCYQIYRTILHKLTKDSGVYNVYSSPALPSGTMGTIKIEEV